MHTHESVAALVNQIHRVIYAIEITILRCSNNLRSVPYISLREPHHSGFIPLRAQIYHSRSAVVILSIEAVAGAFAREQFAKGSVGIAIHAFVGKEAAKGVPAIVIRQLLRDAAPPVVDVVGFQRAPADLFVGGDALHAVVIGGGDVGIYFGIYL